MRTNSGNCLVLILTILLIVWLTAWGGCQLIKKKTQEALEDKPATPATPEAPKK
jgi:hypothetical protein